MLVRKFPNAAGLDLPSLLFHPVMNSINLNVFKASVGETTAFVVVTAVHSRTGCFTWLRPQAASRGCRTACWVFKSCTEAATILIAHKCQYRLLKTILRVRMRRKNIKYRLSLVNGLNTDLLAFQQ